MWNFDKPWHQDPVISPKTKISYVLTQLRGWVMSNSRFTIPFWSLWNLPCRLVSDVFFFPFIHLKIYDHQKWIKRSDWGSISQLHCFNFKQGSFQAFFKCEMSCVSCVFCQHVCCCFCCFSLGTPPPKHINGNATACWWGNSPGGLGLGSQATIVFIAGSQTQRVWHLSRRQLRQLQLELGLSKGRWGGPVRDIYF